jgi:cytoskeletal protein CcmA (bactofilin family)
LNLKKLFGLKRPQRRRSADGVEAYATVIGPESLFEGSLGGKDNYLVYGKVVGDCDIQGTLVVAPGGTWKGDVAADNVVVGGTIRGNVVARTKLELGPSAHVHGDVTSPYIAMAVGASHEGEVRMKQSRITRYSERRGRGERRHNHPKGRAN